MTIINFDFGAHDIPHIGVLFSQIRSGRNITQSDLASWLKRHSLLEKGANIISNFEHPLPTNLPRGEALPPARAKSTAVFDLLVEALCHKEIEGKAVRVPLKPNETKQLTTIYEASNTLSKIKASEAYLMDFDFRETKEHPFIQGVNKLLQQLQLETRPAFLADQLWFIHAINGAGYNLFGIDPESEYPRRWETWHVLGAKLLKNSPVLNAHVSVNGYYPQSIYHFFQDTYPLLFTVQMRSLLARLHQLSAESERTQFERWWAETVTFSLAWEDEPLTRSIKYWGNERERRKDNYVELRAAADERYPEHKDKNRYWLGIWNAKDDLTSTTFTTLTGRVADNQRILFAADYDDGTFHVNQWPGIQEYLLTVNYPGESKS